MSRLPDPILDGLARGWRVHGGRHAKLPAQLDCDVAIVGTGAGAGITAELLTQAGLDVVMVEEGPLKSSRDFNQLESEAYPTLYQESASRKTADKAINIMQGRCVGGSTTVNWTSSFRTPPSTLRYWAEHFGLTDFTETAMAPWFAQVERRLNIHPWELAPNTNNDLLRVGAQKLGIATKLIPRNVKGCWDLGSCGLGCPTNAKQSMLLTTVPAALDKGARLLVQTRAERFEIDARRVVALECVGVNTDGTPAAGASTRIVAKHYVVAGGAINSPALLLRSAAPDPYRLLGKRTFLHPVVVMSSVFDRKVMAWSGAPQSIYCDHFLETDAIDGPIGYKLEVPPLHPVLLASTLPGFGLPQSKALAGMPYTHVLIALLRDGFHGESPGGNVGLRADGSPVLDYPLTDYVMDGARRAFLSMAEIQFAAGARSVQPVHELAGVWTSWPQARDAITKLPMKAYVTRVVSAHVMGGCPMAADEARGVTRPDGRHWQLPNLSVHDGSLFPTSIGANPQVSVYGLANKLATGLARRLAKRDVVLA